MKLNAILMVLCVTTLGCPSDTEKETESKTEKEPERKRKKTAPSASAAPTPVRHDLQPLPISIELPAGSKIVEASEKSAMLEVGGVRMTVSKNLFADTKNTVKNFPFETFQQWVRDEPTAATAQMGADSFRALGEFEIGGAKYVCSNVGTKGMATAEAAEKMVAHCKTLEPKK